MEPETVKKLLAYPDFRDFMSFLASEALKLNTLADITQDDPVEIAIEVKGRKWGYHALTEILKPFINVQEGQPRSTKINEYEM